MKLHSLQVVTNQLLNSLANLKPVTPCRYRDKIRLKYHLDKPYIVKIADTLNEIEQAYTMLQDCYQESGILSNRKSTPMRITKYQIIPSTSLIVLKLHDEVIGTISLIEDSPFGLPIDQMSDFHFLRKTGKKIAEVSSFAIKKQYRMKGLQFLIINFILRYSQSIAGIDFWVISTHPKTINFYRKLLGFLPIDRKSRKYDFVEGSEAYSQYLNIDPKTYRKTLGKMYHDAKKSKNLLQYFDTDFPHHFKFRNLKYYNATSYIMSPKIIDYFFKRQSNVLEQLSFYEIEFLKSIYNSVDYKKIIDKQNYNEEMATQFKEKVEQRFYVNCQGKVLYNNATQVGNIKIIDVSLNGLKGIAGRNLILKNTEQVMLVLEIAHRSNITIETEVSWQREKRIGFKILVSPHSQWREFIDYLTCFYEKAA
ncbi:MAG: GNAT family N-acetyltransferase [Gammaproteobacteria bacterium]|nr:GNAT family N-acetyltransferase [Gammaproteobacteria bacterium]